MPLSGESSKQICISVWRQQRWQQLDASWGLGCLPYYATGSMVRYFEQQLAVEAVSMQVCNLVTPAFCSLHGPGKRLLIRQGQVLCYLAAVLACRPSQPYVQTSNQVQLRCKTSPSLHRMKPSGLRWEISMQWLLLKACNVLHCMQCSNTTCGCQYFNASVCG